MLLFSEISVFLKNYWHAFFGRWRGSIFQKVWKDIFLWVFVYTTFSLTYRFALNPAQQLWFAQFTEFISSRIDEIPLEALLGFFVPIVISRWNVQFLNLGDLHFLAVWLKSCFQARTEREKYIRRAIGRYCCLTQALVFRDLHQGFRRRFPTVESLKTAGLITDEEIELLDEVPTRYNKYWVPLVWANELIMLASDEKQLDVFRTVSIRDDVRTFHACLLKLWTFDWHAIPYVNVRILQWCTYTWSICNMFSRQYIKPMAEVSNASIIDVYFPFMGLFQVVCYVGWMRVAQALLYPFGEDLEDLDCNDIFDRNCNVINEATGEPSDPIPINEDLFFNDTCAPLYTQDAAEDSMKFYLGGSNCAESNQNPRTVVKTLIETKGKEDKAASDEFTMIRHPINDKIDQYLGVKCRYKAGTVVNNPLQMPRMDFFSSEMVDGKSKRGRGSDGQFV